MNDKNVSFVLHVLKTMMIMIKGIRFESVKSENGGFEGNGKYEMVSMSEDFQCECMNKIQS